MAAFTVQAQGLVARAGHGTTRAAKIALIVTDENGMAVRGLPDPAFRVLTLLVGPGGSQVEIAEIQELGTAGVGAYLIEVQPRSDNTWQSGDFVLAVSVAHARGEGQALVTFHISRNDAFDRFSQERLVGGGDG